MPKASFFIKPASDGLIVRDPVTREPLAAAGESKPRNKYWLTRQTDRSVVETEEPAATKKAAAAKPQGGES